MMDEQRDNRMPVDSHELVLPVDILQAMQQVYPSLDPLDGIEFNVVDYINTLFPTEQSLTNIDDAIVKVRQEIRYLDGQIRDTLRTQTEAGAEGQNALKDAQEAIGQLFVQIRDIKQKAEKSEEMVKSITGDIKQLDHAKKNLTSSITTLNHLHMLVGGVDTLESLQSRRQYGEIANLLQGLMHVLEHFDKYLVIPEIRVLADRLGKIRQELGIQLLTDFRGAFSMANAKQGTPSQQLADACRVVSVLNSQIKNELLSWFIKMQLSEYTVLFEGSQDNAWLDKVDKRFTWLKTTLVDFEKRFGPMFPSDWAVSELITLEFCDITRSELGMVMVSRRSEIDVKLLLFAIQKTMLFESFLVKRFPDSASPLVASVSESASLTEVPKLAPTMGYPDDKNPFQSEASNGLKDDAKSTEQFVKVPSNPFQGVISRCFEPFMDIYVDAQDRNLAELMDKFAEDIRAKGVARPTENSLQEGGLGTVLPSCADLFVFYKKCLLQCGQMTYSGQALVQLAGVFRKYLKIYANRVLMANFPKNSSTAISIAAATTGLIQTFLKEGETPSPSRLTEEEVRRICSILTTAEYCCETIQQLQDKLKEKAGPECATDIDFASEQTVFNSVITSSIQLLVNDLETACEPALIAMTKRQWQSVEVVGDQSGFVSAVVTHLRTTLPVLRNYLSSSRKFFTQFCIKFANTFIPKYVAHIYKCKPISAVGAEQLLLDTHMLKTVLLDLPSLGSQISRKPPSSFTKIVVKGMAKAEMILKVVMAPSDNPTVFVEKYIQLLPDSDSSELQKILEMKNIKRGEQVTFLELYRNQGPSTSQHQLATAAAAQGDSALGNEPESGRIRKLEMLIRNRL